MRIGAVLLVFLAAAVVLSATSNLMIQSREDPTSASNSRSGGTTSSSTTVSPRRTTAAAGLPSSDQQEQRRQLPTSLLLHPTHYEDNSTIARLALLFERKKKKGFLSEDTVLYDRRGRCPFVKNAHSRSAKMSKMISRAGRCRAPKGWSALQHRGEEEGVEKGINASSSPPNGLFVVPPPPITLLSSELKKSEKHGVEEEEEAAPHVAEQCESSSRFILRARGGDIEQRKANKLLRSRNRKKRMMLRNLGDIACRDFIAWRKRTNQKERGMPGEEADCTLEWLLEEGRLIKKKVTPASHHHHRRRPHDSSDRSSSGRSGGGGGEGWEEEAEWSINPAAIQDCPFSQHQPYPAHLNYSTDPFAMEGYNLVSNFLFSEAFLRHGWIHVPVAGTALGVLRQRGMFEEDDDMDIVLYPPAHYLYDGSDDDDQEDEEEAVVGDRRGNVLLEKKKKKENGRTMTVTWEEIYEDFDDIMVQYAATQKIHRNGKADDTKVGREPSSTQTTGSNPSSFNPMFSASSPSSSSSSSSSDRPFNWVRVYDMAIEDVGGGHRDNDDTGYKPRKMWFQHTPQNFPQHITMQNRPNVSLYATRNDSSVRRVFFGPCFPNHWTAAMQPLQYLYCNPPSGSSYTTTTTTVSPAASTTRVRNVREAPANGGRGESPFSKFPHMYTAGKRRVLGKLCKAKYGPPTQQHSSNSTFPTATVDSHILAPMNLLHLVELWYGPKWCHPVGAANHRSLGVFKAWND